MWTRGVVGRSETAARASAAFGGCGFLALGLGFRVYRVCRVYRVYRAYGVYWVYGVYVVCRFERVYRAYGVYRVYGVCRVLGYWGVELGGVLLSASHSLPKTLNCKGQKVNLGSRTRSLGACSQEGLVVWISASYTTVMGSGCGATTCIRLETESGGARGGIRGHRSFRPQVCRK